MHIGGGGVQESRQQRTVSALAAGFFLVYLIALSPHLVHHLLEHDHDSPSCPFFVLGQHTPQVQSDPPALTCLIVTEVFEAQKPALVRPTPILRDSSRRAPPSPIALG